MMPTYMKWAPDESKCFNPGNSKVKHHSSVKSHCHVASLNLSLWSYIAVKKARSSNPGTIRCSIQISATAAFHVTYQINKARNREPYLKPRSSEREQIAQTLASLLSEGAWQHLGQISATAAFSRYSLLNIKMPPENC